MTPATARELYEEVRAVRMAQERRRIAAWEHASLGVRADWEALAEFVAKNYRRVEA